VYFIVLSCPDFLSFLSWQCDEFRNTPEICMRAGLRDIEKSGSGGIMKGGSFNIDFSRALRCYPFPEQGFDKVRGGV